MVSLRFKLTGREFSIDVDATLSASHGAKVTVTKHRVESGAKVTDHASTEGETFTLEGIISDTPILPSLREGRTFPRDQRGRAFDTALLLYRAKDARVLMTIVTPLRVYRNMILADLQIPQDKATDGLLKFSASFEQMVFATTQQVANPAVNKGKDKVEGGAKPVAEAPAPVQTSPSWLWQGGTKVSSWFQKKG